MVEKESKYVSDIEKIRAQARERIEDGAVTEDYSLDKEQAIEILNQALATEIVCVLRYRYHYFMASGIHKYGAAEEFLQHSNEEQGHADLLAERIKQLGGKPQMDPAKVSEASHAEYVEGNTLEEMLTEDLVAERIAIQTYRAMIGYFGEKDPTTRRMLEDILAVEEEHADDIADLLFRSGGDDLKKSAVI